MNLIPTDEKLEKAFLGGLLLDPEGYGDILELFHEDLFSSRERKVVARAIKALKNDGKIVDILSVHNWIKSKGLNVEIFDISNLTNGAMLYGFYEKCLILNEFYIRRTLILNSNKIMNAASVQSNDVFELIAESEKNLNELTGKIAVANTPDATDCHHELINHLNIIDKLEEGKLIGINTGFSELNRLTAGWQKTDLIILAARPGMGKTSFALNCTMAASRETPVLFFSLEMSRLQLYARLCSQTTSIPLEYFLKYKMGPDYRVKFNQMTQDLANAPIFIDDKGGMDINYIKTKSRKMKRDKGLGLIVIDYLQLISRVRTQKSTNDEISEISGSLKGLAKELDIPIICLSQLTRAVESTPDKRPSLIHLRDGGSIEQDADIVQFIYRPEYYEIMDDGYGGSTIGKAEIITAKQRNGALGTTVLGFDGKCTNFYQLF